MDLEDEDPTFFNILFELEKIRCITEDILVVLKDIDREFEKGKTFRPMKRCPMCDAYGFYEEISEWGCDQCSNSDSLDYGSW